MAVNEQGYVRPAYEELLEARTNQAIELFGEDIDTSDASPLGKFIRLAVQDLADAYEAQEIIYYSRFPHTATGHSLDRLMPFAGITRNPATRAEHEITFTGTAGYLISAGFLVSTPDGVEFYLVNDLVLDENGSGVGIVQAVEAGIEGNVMLGDITDIVNPDADIEAVSHTGIESVAEDEENDEALRKRFSAAIEGSGSGTISAIRGAIMRINGVSGCLILANDSHEAVDGRPPHSFEVFVHASDALDQEIANTIFEKKPLGIQTVGNVSVNVEDVSGGTQVIKFSRVAETVVYIRVSVSTDSSFGLDGVEQIQTALAEKINSLSTGEDIIYTSLFKQLFSVAGVVDVTSLTLSTDGNTYKAQNIPMDESSVARVSEANIVVEVTDYEDK